MQLCLYKAKNRAPSPLFSYRVFRIPSTTPVQSLKPGQIMRVVRERQIMAWDKDLNSEGVAKFYIFPDTVYICNGQQKANMIESD